MAHDGVITLQARLVDRFGDNGLISVVAARRVDDMTFEIEIWLMSCRVLGRQVEHAVANLLVARALAAGAERLVGIFHATERNTMVRDHYGHLGFKPESQAGDTARWVLDLARFTPFATPIRIEIAL